MPRLKKLDVERLLNDYDLDPVAALTRALRITLDQPDGEWTAMVKAAGRTARLEQPPRAE